MLDNYCNAGSKNDGCSLVFYLVIMVVNLYIMSYPAIRH